MIQGCFPEGGKWNFSKTSYGYNPKNSISKYVDSICPELWIERDNKKNP